MSENDLPSQFNACSWDDEHRVPGEGDRSVEVIERLRQGGIWNDVLAA